MKCTGCLNIKILGKKNWKIAIFQNLTYQLQTQFSQLPNGQISKFQCPSDAEFPEFFETGLFFYPSPFLLGVMVKKPWHNFFWDTLYLDDKKFESSDFCLIALDMVQVLVLHHVIQFQNFYLVFLSVSLFQGIAPCYAILE